MKRLVGMTVRWAAGGRVTRRALCAGVSCLVATWAVGAAAELVRWEVQSRAPYAEGRPRGSAGPYEEWRGRVHFALDPADEANAAIVDLPLAPRNAAGRVEFSADFRLLVPADRGTCNGTLFYEVNNRGNATAPRLIDGGADDFLCRQGFIVLWSGWIAEAEPGEGRLRLEAPEATADGRPIRGLVRCEVVVNAPVPRASLSHRGRQGVYRPSPRGLAEARLTRRQREADPREEVPRGDWKLVGDLAGATGPLTPLDLEVAGGLRPGWIYELVYEAERPVVQGVGLAGIRDIVSAVKHGSGADNPLCNADGGPLVRRAIGFGTSQSGRCLRQFLWEGFNADERSRQVFDGVLAHVAGGGLGSFNHRFASPTRTNCQHEEHLFPVDFFPFTYGDATDPFTGRTDGILRRCREQGTVPKVFHTQSTSEYWHRSGSLVHTDPSGERDAEIPAEVRIYSFGGSQHAPGDGVAAPRTNAQLPESPVDYRPFLRALVVALDAWVAEGTPPPPSVFPTVGDRTLVGWTPADTGWPSIPGVVPPTVVQRPPWVDRGPDWESRRMATIEPPIVRGHYGVRVPAVDADGNERGTLDMPAVAVPLATYTGWNTRDASIGAAGELMPLTGGCIPFPRDRAARAAAGDPRPSIAERFPGHADYERRYREAAAALVERRYLLAEDLPRLEALCRRFVPLFGE
jgi:hypothetical protein